MNADDEKKLREAFEKWVSSSPFECSTERMTEKSAWPGRYRFSSVSLAWEAWQDAHSAGRARGMTESAGICGEYASIELIAEKCAAAIIAARDA